MKENLGFWGWELMDERRLKDKCQPLMDERR